MKTRKLKKYKSTKIQKKQKCKRTIEQRFPSTKVSTIGQTIQIGQEVTEYKR